MAFMFLRETKNTQNDCDSTVWLFPDVHFLYSRARKYISSKLLRA